MTLSWHNKEWERVAPKRKRAPGGGRKPINPEAKAANFSTRITPETRAQLDAEAAARGLSVSQIAEEMLQLGLQAKRARQIDDPLRALSHVLRLLADRCRYVHPDVYREWHNDSFAFDAFARAVQMLFERLRPDGEVKAPPASKYPGLPTWPTSERQAEVALASVWQELVSQPIINLRDTRYVPLQGASETQEEAKRGRAIAEKMMGRISSYTHSLEDVRRALGIKLEGKGS